MPSLNQLIRELARHAMAKKGAQPNTSWCQFDVLEEPHVDLAGVGWLSLFEVDQDIEDERHVARLPALSDTIARHRARYPAIRDAGWEERDGHVYMEVPLDADVPVEFLKSLIDEAYVLMWNKLDASDRTTIELAGLPYDEPKLIDRLIDLHGLARRRDAIHNIVRPAILLRTKKSPEAKIPPGSTKIGGRPDLPAATPWPSYRDGKPLAFLAQIDFGEIAKLTTPIEGLPSDGLLSLFSVWGWMDEGAGDPQTPSDETERTQEDHGWTVALHTPPRAKLERLKTPRGVNAFPAAAVEPTAILSLPNHRLEPPLAALGWTDEEFERFDEMQSRYRLIQMSHFLGSSDSLASHHLLGGYALFQQQFPEEVVEKGLPMLLQIGTDRNSKMGWGDGGELTFYADAKALSSGRFERLWGTCQGG